MDMHGLYFIGYAVCATIAGIVIVKAQYIRKEREGTPINYKIMKVVFGVALFMWTGAALSAVYYTESHAALTISGIFIGVILSGFFAWQINAVIRKIQRDEQALEDLATHDALTGLWIRRTLFQTLREEIKASAGQNRPLSLMMLSIDNLDDFHEQHGYEAGDFVLRKVAKMITKFVGSDYPVIRFRSNTIAIIFPKLTAQAAAEYGTSLQAEVEAHAFDIGKDNTASVTINVGVAAYSEQTPTKQSLIDAGEGALFKAIGNGSNSISVA